MLAYGNLINGAPNNKTKTSTSFDARLCSHRDNRSTFPRLSFKTRYVLTNITNIAVGTTVKASGEIQ